MRHIIEVFLYEFKRNLSRKAFLFTTFGLPLIVVALIIGYDVLQQANQGDETAVEAVDAPEFDFSVVDSVGYIDRSGLFTEPTADVFHPFGDEESAQAALEAGEVDVYYVIAADYVDTGQVTLVVPHFQLNLVSSGPIEQFIFSHLSRGVSEPAILQRLYNPAIVEVCLLERGVDSNDCVVDSEDANFVVIYVFAIVFLLGIFLTNGYLMQSVIEEKENRIVEILISSVTPGQLLTGKVLALGLIGMLQIVVWVGSLLVIAQLIGQLASFQNTDLSFIRIPVEMLPIGFIYFVLGYLFFAAAYGIVGALSSSMQEGPQYAVVFTIPAAVPFYFFTLFLTQPEHPLVIGFSLFPMTSPLAMMMRLVASPEGVPLVQILISLLLLVLGVAGMLWLSGRLFRVQTLLAGQTPKIRDIPKLLRG